MQNYWPLKPVKLGYQDDSHPIKWSYMIYHLICFSLFPSSTWPKETRLSKIYILTWKSYLSDGNFSPSCINALGNILLDIMDDSPVWFTIWTNIISSNPIAHIVDTFLLVPQHWKSQFKSRERKRGQIGTKKFQSHRKS